MRKGVNVQIYNNYILRDFIDELRTLPTPHDAMLPDL